VAEWPGIIDGWQGSHDFPFASMRNRSLRTRRQKKDVSTPRALTTHTSAYCAHVLRLRRENSRHQRVKAFALQRTFRVFAAPPTAGESVQLRLEHAMGQQLPTNSDACYRPQLWLRRACSPGFRGRVTP
jgi:hypothetical protein